MVNGEKGYYIGIKAIKDYYMPIPIDQHDRKGYRGSRSTLIAYDLFLLAYIFFYPAVHVASLENNPTQGLIVLTVLNCLVVIFASLFSWYLYKLFQKRTWFKHYHWMTIASFIIAIITILRSLFILF